MLIPWQHSHDRGAKRKNHAVSSTAIGSCLKPAPLLDMPGDEAALLNVEAKENTPPHYAERLSHSSHPPHRDQTYVFRGTASCGAPVPDARFPSIVNSYSLTPRVGGSTYFDANHRKRRKESSSPSESGTEADDEKGASLLRLPAPPSRPRKGFKGSSGSGTASSLLTPSYLDKELPRLASKSRKKSQTGLRSPSYTEEETRKLREKFTRRRRAELIRRVSETILLGAVGFIACSNDIAPLGRLLARGRISAGNHAWTSVINYASTALLSHAAVVSGLYVLYPLRIIFKSHSRSIFRGRSRFYIHVPAAFEPAPLLYPVLVPVFVALSLVQVDTSVLLPNLVLSIASIPSKVIPFNTDVPWHSSLHWLFSVIPVLTSGLFYPFYAEVDMGTVRSMHGAFEVENLLLLYPLHQALMSALGYLTTTSLLPAELQLLSVSMINLLLLSRSPQAIILQSLLWLGGLSVFILCGKVLSWGVALARIPSWRFKRSKARAREGNAVLSAIDDCSKGRLGRWGLISAGIDESDSDELQIPPNDGARKTHRRQQLSVDTRRADPVIGGTLAELKRTPTSAMENDTQSGFPKIDGAMKPSQANSKRQRRYTLPSYVGRPTDSPSKETLKNSWTAPLQLTKAWSFRSLNRAQGQMVKWLFAIYVYAVVIAVIALAIRTYIGRHALHEQEPVGWSLGYLLGEMPLFRQYVHCWDLEYWICLPPRVPTFVRSTSYSWALLNRDDLGAANIRMLICIYCLTIIATGLAVVFRLSAVADVDTRRKVFHGMMVAMFLPTIFIDPAFVSLALILILAIFLLLDLFRASQLPPLSRPLTYFLAPYVDGRDHRGPVIVSHIFLLIGCAIPLWLSLAAIARTGQIPWEGWEVQRREVSMISGVVCVGLGDAAASLIGRRFGRRRWCWSGGKSLEGSLAFAVAVVLGLSFARWWLLLGSWHGDYGDSWATTFGKATIAATCASLTEAVLTGGNDNVIVPVILWLLVRGLRI